MYVHIVSTYYLVESFYFTVSKLVKYFTRGTLSLLSHFRSLFICGGVARSLFTFKFRAGPRASSWGVLCFIKFLLLPPKKIFFPVALGLKFDSDVARGVLEVSSISSSTRGTLNLFLTRAVFLRLLSKITYWEVEVNFSSTTFSDNHKIVTPNKNFFF